MSAMSVFDEISRFLPFLGQVVGPEAEILLCDTENILDSVNPISDWGLPGKPLGARAFERGRLSDHRLRFKLPRAAALL